MKDTILEIDTEKELQNIIARLYGLPNQIASPKILMSATNSAAREVQEQLLKGAKEKYAVSREKIWEDKKQGAPKVITARASDPSAVIRSRGPMQEIMAFMTRPNTETGAAAAKVLNSGSMKPLEKGDLKAFLARFKSGHVAIVQREGRERLPVKKLLSPAVPHMLGNEEVREQAEGIAYATLQKEIQKRIDKLNLK